MEPLQKKLAKPKLSSRMLSFVSHAIKSEPFWDVCCDHGYVGIKALECGLFPEVHFVDQVPHIMERLQILIGQSKEKHSSTGDSLHLISGENIELDVYGTLLIAGVGGLTIKNIVSSLLAKNKLKASRLLLSPHTDEKVLIHYLDNTVLQRLYTVSEKVMLAEGPRERPLYILDLKSGHL